MNGCDYMKIWTKIKLKDQDKIINITSKSLTNYIYKDSPIEELSNKYNIDQKDIDKLNQYTVNRVAGLLLLYASNDISRINDIVNKYNFENNKEVQAEIEGYINK